MNLGGFPMTDAGDCLRMAVAFIDEAYGQRLESAYLLSRAVAGAATASDEQAVCATQLQWWHEELERLCAARPAERVGLEEDTPTFTREWLVDAERQLVGPPPEDEASHRVTGFRRYGSALMLAVGPEVREAAGSAIRETSVALYALFLGTGGFDQIVAALEKPELQHDPRPRNLPRLFGTRRRPGGARHPCHRGQ